LPDKSLPTWLSVEQLILTDKNNIIQNSIAE
jgi:hypothetical protein